MADKKSPVKEMLRRRNVQGAIWKHTDSNGATNYTVGVTKSYKDKNGNWQNETLYLSVDDIPKVIATLQEAETTMYELIQSDYDKSKEAA